VNDGIAVEIIHGGDEAILKLLLGGDANVPQDGTREFRKEALDEIKPGAVVRVHPKTFSRITEFSQHEADGCEFQERESAAVEIFPILGEATAAVKQTRRSRHC
jgi:hypothetical protein